MRRLYFVLDLAPLRGEERPAHLQHLAAALARAWAAFRAGDTSFGYSLYDSATGDYILGARLQRAAAALSELPLPAPPAARDRAAAAAPACDHATT
jgi:hypothetical protein